MKGIPNSFVCNKDLNKPDNFLGKVLLYLGSHFLVKTNFNGVYVIQVYVKLSQVNAWNP